MDYEYEQETDETQTTTAEETENQTSEEEVDYEALEQKTAQRLANAFSDDADSVDEGEDEEDEDQTDEEESDDSEEQDDSEEESEAGDDDAEEAAAEDEHESPSDAPTLPDAHRRSLKAYGWKDDEIDQNLQALGDSFLKTAERIHENRNTELQQWAQAGRQARQQGGEEEQDDSSKSGQSSAGKSELPGSLERIDKQKLREQYGEDELIDTLVDPLNKVIDGLNEKLPVVEQQTQQVEQERLEEVNKRVESFFGRDDLKPYQELYGGPSDQLSEDQVQNRNKVLDTAYDLMVGSSQLRGQQLSLDEALDSAHAIVAKDHTVSAARKGVKKEAKKRNRGLSQKPSRKKGSAAKSDTGRPQSREELEQRTASRLQNAFS